MLNFFYCYIEINFKISAKINLKPTRFLDICNYKSLIYTYAKFHKVKPFDYCDIFRLLEYPFRKPLMVVPTVL